MMRGIDGMLDGIAETLEGIGNRNGCEALCRINGRIWRLTIYPINLLLSEREARLMFIFAVRKIVKRGIRHPIMRRDSRNYVIHFC